MAVVIVLRVASDHDDVGLGLAVVRRDRLLGVDVKIPWNDTFQSASDPIPPPADDRGRVAVILIHWVAGRHGSGET